MENSIVVNKLTKKYGDFKAVDAVDLSIRKGELFGLLGPNGAGKSTTISMLATILSPTSGSAKLNGFNLDDSENVRRSIGIVFQDPSLDDELTARENLEFHARVYHLTEEEKKKRIPEVLEIVGLSDKAELQIKTFSGGMKRRLEIARGLLHYPKILFLDEPTIGLDPQTRRNIWEHIQRLNKEHKITVVLTTHYMDEADYLCDRVAIVDKGKIIALDTPENLKNVMGGDIIIIDTDDKEKLQSILKFDWVKEVKEFEGKINITVSDGEKAIPKLLELSTKHKIKINSVNLNKPTLEDVFIHYTGRAIRDESASSKDILKSHSSAMWRR